MQWNVTRKITIPDDRGAHHSPTVKISSYVLQCSGPSARAGEYECAVPAPICCSECDGRLPHGGTFLTFSCCPMDAHDLQRDPHTAQGMMRMSMCGVMLRNTFSSNKVLLLKLRPMLLPSWCYVNMVCPRVQVRGCRCVVAGAGAGRGVWKR